MNFQNVFYPQMTSNTKLQRIFLTTLILIISPINSDRILGLFPHPGFSHFQFFHPIMQALAEAGHEVTVVSYFSEMSIKKSYKDEPLMGRPVMKNFLNLGVGRIYIKRA